MNSTKNSVFSINHQLSHKFQQFQKVVSPSSKMLLSYQRLPLLFVLYTLIIRINTSLVADILFIQTNKINFFEMHQQQKKKNNLPADVTSLRNRREIRKSYPVGIKMQQDVWRSSPPLYEDIVERTHCLLDTVFTSPFKI